MTRDDAPPRGFAQAEFEARTARAPRLMAAREIDALPLTTELELLSRRAAPEMPVIA